MKRRLVVNLVVASLIMFYGCKKDKPFIPVQLPESVSHNGTLIYEFEYDNKNRISKIIQYVGIGTNEFTPITSLLIYNEVGDLISQKSDLYNDIMLNFTKSEDGRYIYLSNGMIIELNSQKLPIKRIYPNLFAPNLTLSYEYRYNNLSTLTTHYDNPYSINYTHDDKNSPFYYCNTPKWYMLCWLFNGSSDFTMQIFDLRNNRLTAMSLLEEEAIDIFYYLYTYDDAGYPLICKRVRNDGVADGIITYTYIKK